MRNPWISALVSAAAALAVAAPVLAGGAGTARLALAIVAGLAAALVAGGLFARPTFLALDRWRRAGDDIVRRLLGTGEETSTPDPARRLENLAAPSRAEALEESISDLAAALQDEERLSRRRGDQREPVGSALQRGRELAVGTPDDAEGTRRVGGLLDEIETGGAERARGV